jgi:hypothetical protein
MDKKPHGPSNLLIQIKNQISYLLTKFLAAVRLLPSAGGIARTSWRPPTHQAYFDQDLQWTDCLPPPEMGCYPLPSFDVVVNAMSAGRTHFVAAEVADDDVGQRWILLKLKIAN